MTGAHDLFKALGPVDWDAFAAQDSREALTPIFNDAESIINSIPGSAVPEPSSPEVNELRKGWKEVKINPRENPLGLNVYKLSSKDGRGAWFAKRSIHKGLSFETWKAGMETELAEGLKVQGEPGDGAIRGLGADRRVVDETVDGCGKMQVYQLSARFGGPTTPRDFVTLCLSSDSAIRSPDEPARRFILVSKPCNHPECQPREGYIRGSYESVELIREVKTGASGRRATTAGNAPSLENAKSVSDTELSRPRGKTVAGAGDDTGLGDAEDDGTEIEWLMITRSDPGGSVPRFLVERGMAPVLASDADKFFKWISSSRNSDASGDDDANTKQTTGEEVKSAFETPVVPVSAKMAISEPSKGSAGETQPVEDARAPGGFYGIVAGALGTAASLAASRLPISFNTTASGETESDISSTSLSDDASSIASFHSLEAGEDAEPPAEATERVSISDTLASTQSTESGTTTRPTQHEKHERELKKLEERRRKMEEKLQRARERALAKRSEDAARDEQALQKLKERHERDMAKQEEKYRRERERLEAKKANEEKKAEARRRKQAEREEKANLSLELVKTRAERDLAHKEIEILKEQVGQLQALNTELVARVGRGRADSKGGDVDDDLLKKAATLTMEQR